MSTTYWQCANCELVNSSINNQCNSCFCPHTTSLLLETEFNHHIPCNITSWTSIIQTIQSQNSKHWQCAKPYIDWLFNKTHYSKHSIQSKHQNDINNNYNNENKCIYLVIILKQLTDLNMKYMNEFRYDLIRANILKINILTDLLSLNSLKLQSIRNGCNNCNKLQCYICRAQVKVNGTYINVDGATIKHVVSHNYGTLRITATTNNVVVLVETQPKRNPFFNINVKTGKMFVVNIVQDSLHFIIYDMNTHQIEFQKHSEAEYDGLRHIDIIPNYSDYHPANDNIMVKIVHYWQRIEDFEAVNIPNDIYHTINQFYSLYNRNFIHIILYSYKYYSDPCHIDHEIIDINEHTRNDSIVLQTQLLSTLEIETKKYTELGSRFPPVCRNGKFELISIHKNQILSVNLHNGYMQLLPKNIKTFNEYHKRLCQQSTYLKLSFIGDGKYSFPHDNILEDFEYYYDMVEVCNPFKQYFFFSRFSNYTKHLELFIIDKTNLEMIPIYFDYQILKMFLLHLDNGFYSYYNVRKLVFDGNYLYWIRRGKNLKVKVEVDRNKIKCI